MAITHEEPKTQAQQVFEYIQWGIILLFATPTVLIMASWNSLPGARMYEVKRMFEQALLFVAKPSYAAEASLNVQFTQRRFNEAKVLLANDQSTEGLTYLSQQIRATKAVIERAPSKTKQKEIAQQYIATLRTVSQELEAQQQSLVLAPSGSTARRTASGRVIYPTYTPRPTRSPNVPVEQPTATPRPNVPTATPRAHANEPTPTPTPMTQPDTPTDEVDDVQEEIEDTIEDLEQLANALDAPPENQESDARPSINPTMIQQFIERNNDEEDRDRNRGNGNWNNNDDRGDQDNNNGRNEEENDRRYDNNN